MLNGWGRGSATDALVPPVVITIHTKTRDAQCSVVYEPSPRLKFDSRVSLSANVTDLSTNRFVALSDAKPSASRSCTTAVLSGAFLSLPSFRLMKGLRTLRRGLHAPRTPPRRCISGVETVAGDPTEELRRQQALARDRKEAEEQAHGRAEKRGHVSLDVDIDIDI